MTGTTTRFKLFFGSKVFCIFCFDICTLEGRGGEKREGMQISNKDTLRLSLEIAMRPVLTPGSLCYPQPMKIRRGIFGSAGYWAILVCNICRSFLYDNFGRFAISFFCSSHLYLWNYDPLTCARK